MGPKRGAEGQSGPEKKRLKLREQRTIRVGGSQEQGNHNLPATIDVEKFAQARLFEIQSLQEAMKNAKAASTVRAFQSLPRALRRRAASHNIRRLPVSLRAKAISETPKDAAKPKTKSRKMQGAKKRRKKSRYSRADMLFKRRHNKIWLETHIWHAKRMHMTEIWGHRLALKPTEKAFRSSYRSSYHGTQVHDASYHQYIHVSGLEEDLGLLLMRVCKDPSANKPWSKRYSNGTRECPTSIHDYGTTGMTVDTCLAYHLLGPITIIWCPPSLFQPSQSPATEISLPQQRQLLIRLHPSLSLPVLHSLLRAATGWGFAMIEDPPPPPVGKDHDLSPKIKIKPLREGTLVTFEVMGKRAAEVLKGVLKVTKECTSTVGKKDLWKKLGQGGAGVPSGMVMGLEVWDPRLSFPPKLIKETAEEGSGLRGEHDLLRPSAEGARLDEFWQVASGNRAMSVGIEKSELDKRRGKLLVPGTRLTPTATDTRIPLLISQRTLFSPSSPNTAITGFTVTLPGPWGLPFFLSLIHTQSRAAGLNQRSQQYFESGVPRYPEDYPGTPGYREWEVRRREEDQGRWERRPKGKRDEWDALGTKHPWTGAWDTLGSGEVWIVPAAVVAGVVSKVQTLGLGSPTRDSDGEKKRAEGPLALIEAVWSNWRENGSKTGGALVRVRILPVGRGAPEELACVYSMKINQREIMNRLLKADSEKVGKAKEWDVVEELGEKPTPEQVIGRVTSGEYSLKRGRGYAVGAVTLTSFLELVQQDCCDSPSQGSLVLVRNRGSQKFRLATLEILV